MIFFGKPLRTFPDHALNRRRTPMFVVNDMPKQIDGSLVELLEQAETATIGHVLYEGFVDRGIAPLLPRRRVAGTAVTLRLPHADSTLLHYACKLVRPGDVVLI